MPAINSQVEIGNQDLVRTVPKIQILHADRRLRNAHTLPLELTGRV